MVITKGVPHVTDTVSPINLGVAELTPLLRHSRPPLKPMELRQYLMNDKLVISLFDFTGNAVRPWADAGYKCLCVDTQHKGEVERDGITYVGSDVRHWHAPCTPIAFAFAFPPCTDLAVSGRAWFKNKGLFRLAQAIELFGHAVRIAEASNAPYLIENPVSTISTYWRKPDYTFNPCDYGGYLDPPGDAYTKKTCLWTGGGFVMPELRRVEPIEGSKMHKLPPSADRANLRSATPLGFAQAIYEANSGK